jgi:hypothetical protein
MSISKHFFIQYHTRTNHQFYEFIQDDFRQRYVHTTQATDKLDLCYDYLKTPMGFAFYAENLTITVI